MNGRDDEAWLDTLLQRRLPSKLSDDGFRRDVLRHLPPESGPRCAPSSSSFRGSQQPSP